MRARLVQLEGPGPRRQHRLEQTRTVIGRDPAAELFLDTDRISRRHAVIEAVGGGHQLADLGSTNGTLVNGHPVEGLVVLRPGDRIGLADEVVLLYDVSGGGGGARLLGMLLVLALLGGGGFFGWHWWAARPDPTLEHATMLAWSAVQSWRGGDADSARRGLQAAAGVLYTKGELDDEERGNLLPAAFSLIQLELTEPVDLDAIFRQTLVVQAQKLEAREKVREEQAPTPVERGCRLEEVNADQLDSCIDAWMRRVMVGLRQDPDEVPADFNRVIAERMWKEHGFIRRSFRRGEEVVPMLQEELAASNMPAMLHYLALIESGYRPEAGSSAGAVGIWQFMPKTAAHYGLKVSEDDDERKDPRKSTQAAARYLRDLVFEFGGNAMLLALASYNRGENGVRRALKKLDDPFSDRSYWRLVDEGLLPEETADYVPRFMAAAVAGEGGLPSQEVLAGAGYGGSPVGE